MRRSTIREYVAAVALVACAAGLETLLWPWVQPSLSPLFTASVMLAALYGGLGPAMLATALSAVASAFFFLPPTHSLSIGADDAMRLAVFLSVAVGVSSVAAARRRAELRLVEAREAAERANRAKDHFLALVTHELRSPLTPVLYAARLMESDASLPSQARGDAALICRNVALQSRIIDDLLDAARIASGKLEAVMEPGVDVHALLHDCVAACEAEAAAKSVAIAREFNAADPVLREADGARLRQLFGNLLRNAIKFTPADGRVVLRTSARPGGRGGGGGGVRVEVADTGVGIAPDVLPKLFRPFEQGGRDTTRRFGGLGLGLSIVKAVAELHGGRVTADSPGPGRGATFTVDLPGAPDPGPIDDPRPPRREGEAAAAALTE